MATELRERMVRHMRIAGRSDKTIETYVFQVSLLARHYNASPDMLSTEEIHRYLEHCIVERKHANATINQACAAFRYFYKKVLKRDDTTFSIPTRKQPKKLPRAMTHEQIHRLLEDTLNLKHKSIFATAYGSGLRMKELCNLKVTHIDRSQMQIRVEQGKGRKDRYTILPSWLLCLLEKYARAYKPVDHLFYGKKTSMRCTEDSIGHAFNSSLKKFGIRGFRGIHTLRHTFATHMLIAGTDIYAVSRMLGHTTIKTTESYLHILPATAREMPDPLTAIM